MLTSKEFKSKYLFILNIDYSHIMAVGNQIYLFILQELQSTVDHTMIFRLLVYVFNNLLRFFLSTPPKKRGEKGFRLPAMIPIVFYNGEEKWTAVKSLKEYQYDGQKFGNYILNLEYYLIDLKSIEESFILSTNTVIDNIMYCDRYRKKDEIIDALKKTYERVEMLDRQEQTQFSNWVKNILLSVCENKEAVLAEVLSRADKGEEDMAFEYNMVKMIREEQAAARARGLAEGKIEGLAEGKAEAITDLLNDHGEVSEELRLYINEQKDLNVLGKWIKLAAKASSVQEFEELIQKE